MKLISMTEFVLENSVSSHNPYSIRVEHEYKVEAHDQILAYAKFLRQPLTLEMFIPVDEEGNVLEKPEEYDSGLWHHAKKWDVEDYRKAQEKVLFEGLKCKLAKFKGHDAIYINGFHQLLSDFKFLTVEDLAHHGIELSPSALKQIGL